jgi:hypothetical protein
MPYVACPACGLRTYSAAAWAETDHCPVCAEELPARSGRFVAVHTHASEVRMAQIKCARAALQRLRERASEG